MACARVDRQESPNRYKHDPPASLCGQPRSAPGFSKALPHLRSRYGVLDVAPFPSLFRTLPLNSTLRSPRKVLGNRQLSGL